MEKKKKKKETNPRKDSNARVEKFREKAFLPCVIPLRIRIFTDFTLDPDTIKHVKFISHLRFRRLDHYV